MCLLPTEIGCQDYIVSDIEPIFSASPAVAAALSNERDEAGQNTLLSRRIPGGFLKVVAAKAPRNLRRHNVRILFINEADGMEATAEGSPIMLAERHPLSFPGRRTVMSSMPVQDDTSHVLRAYAQSGARIFEVPCPACGAMTKIRWTDMAWDEGASDRARFRCPIVEWKPESGTSRSWSQRGTGGRPVPKCGDMRVFDSTPSSTLHANVARGKLAAEFAVAKDDPTTLQTFDNTILGQGWRSKGDELAEDELAARAAPFG